MDHLKEYKEHEEDDNIFEKFSDMVKKLVPGLKKDGEIEAAKELEQLDTPENVEKVKKNIFHRTADFAKDTWEATKRESKETKQAMKILQRMVKGEEVPDNEKKFLKAQSGDLIKGIAAVAISGLPVPFPITPLLIIVGKKYNFNVLPKDQQHLLDEIEPPSDEAPTDV